MIILVSIYKATVTSDNFVKTYNRSKRQSFKKRWYGYCISFRIENPKYVPCEAIRDSSSSSNTSDSSNSNLFYADYPVNISLKTLYMKLS